MLPFLPSGPTRHTSRQHSTHRLPVCSHSADWDCAGRRRARFALAAARLLVGRGSYSAARTFARYDPGTVRNAMLSRFAPLIATIATERFTSSSSLNCARAIS